MLAALLLITTLQVFMLRYVNPPFLLVTPFQSVARLMGARGAGKPPSWCPYNKISPHIKRAVLAAEDQRFLTHSGFDFVELNEALKDLATGSGFRGASTLTMQVARTLFLWPDRTWVRKGLEAYYTVLLEIFLPKKRILELYLNTVDWGKAGDGIQAAADTYFHVSPERLTPRQSALLAAVLPSPHRWSPAAPNDWVLKRQKRILRDMKHMSLP